MKTGILKESLTDANGTSNIPYLNENTELIERHDVEGTPFKIVGNKDQGYWVTMGMYRLTERKEEIQDVINEINEKNWEMIGNFIYAVMAGRDLLNDKLTREAQTNN